MTVATSMRVPARQGLPNRMPGSSEMPGKISMPLLLCLRPTPVVKKRGSAKQPATGNLQPATARRAGPASNHERIGTGRLGAFHGPSRVSLRKLFALPGRLPPGRSRPAARGGAAEARRLRGEPGDLVQLGRDVEIQLLAIEIGALVEQRVATRLLAGELRRELRQQRGVGHLQR